MHFLCIRIWWIKIYEIWYNLNIWNVLATVNMFWNPKSMWFDKFFLSFFLSSNFKKLLQKKPESCISCHHVASYFLLQIEKKSHFSAHPFLSIDDLSVVPKSHIPHTQQMMSKNLAMLLNQKNKDLWDSKQFAWL